VKTARFPVSDNIRREAGPEALQYPVAAHIRSASREAARLLSCGDAELAESRSRRVLEQAPDCVEALFVLSQCVKRRGSGQQEYESLLRRIVRLAPYPQASLELADLLLSRNEMEECEEHARNAAALAPHHPLTQRTIGIVFLKTGRPAAAEFHLRKLIELVGERPRACALLADSLKLQGKLDESEEWLAKAAAGNPDDPDLWVIWCRMAEARGRRPQAWEMLQKAEAIAPDAPGVRLARAVLLEREGKKSEADKFLSDALARDSKAAPLFLERGRIRKGLGRYDEAWADFAEGKRLCREADGLTYERERVDALVGRLKQFFTRERRAPLPQAQERTGVSQPLFILGFPRSGTTLVEQILAQHDRVRAGDELEFLANVARVAPPLLGSSLGYPECLAELALGDNCLTPNLLRDVYLNAAEQTGLLTGDHIVFTDKMPLNEMHLGLLAILFPHALLIYVRRHPLDVVCSNFAHHLRHGFNQAFELSSIARHYVVMDELTEHYRREIDLNLLEVRYENVVVHPERELRRMLDSARLEFDPRCLDFHQGARVPRTISYAQVAEKLYGHSVYRYRHFRKHLDETVSILEPVIRRLGYPVD
jgi:tetratricopeptide (TPR) repeat protein